MNSHDSGLSPYCCGIGVQLGIDADQVHVRFVVGVEGSHVTPVGFAFAILVHERKGEDAIRIDDRGDDVPTEVVATASARGIAAQLLVEEPGGEDVDAHRREAVGIVARYGFWIGGLLFKAHHATVGVDLDDAESTGRLLARIIDCKTNEVIREVPPERVLEFVKRFQEFLGLLFDEQA